MPKRRRKVSGGMLDGSKSSLSSHALLLPLSCPGKASTDAAREAEKCNRNMLSNCLRPAPMRPIGVKVSFTPG